MQMRKIQRIGGENKKDKKKTTIKEVTDQKQRVWNDREKGRQKHKAQIRKFYRVGAEKNTRNKKNGKKDNERRQRLIDRLDTDTDRRNTKDLQSWSEEEEEEEEEEDNERGYRLEIDSLERQRERKTQIRKIYRVGAEKRTRRRTKRNKMKEVRD